MKAPLDQKSRFRKEVVEREGQHQRGTTTQEGAAIERGCHRERQPQRWQWPLPATNIVSLRKGTHKRGGLTYFCSLNYLTEGSIF
jgi:hypothetical protein